MLQIHSITKWLPFFPNNCLQVTVMWESLWTRTDNPDWQILNKQSLVLPGHFSFIPNGDRWIQVWLYSLNILFTEQIFWGWTSVWESIEDLWGKSRTTASSSGRNSTQSGCNEIWISMYMYIVILRKGTEINYTDRLENQFLCACC